MVPIVAVPMCFTGCAGDGRLLARSLLNNVTSRAFGRLLETCYYGLLCDEKRSYKYLEI